MCEQFILKIGEIHTYRTGSFGWPRGFEACLRAPDGTIYLPEMHKSVDKGKTVTSHENADANAVSILHMPEGVVLSRSGLFLALDEYAYYRSPDLYEVKAWRSTDDDLRSMTVEQSLIRVPNGPKRSRKPGEWFGLYLFRTILELSDGTLLATVEGSLDSDRVFPTGRRDRAELTDSPKLRTFIISSQDQGRNWQYLSSVAVPQEDDQAVGEGFAEPSLVRLDNGQLLCVMRSGNYTPLYQCWSSDDGKTWSEPVYTGLERGVDPCLIRLVDGRLLLAYGLRYPAGSCGGSSEDGVGASLIELAISQDGTGRTWSNPVTIGSGIYGTYPTIFEVEPNLIFCHAGPCYWRIMLMPRIPDTL